MVPCCKGELHKSRVLKRRQGFTATASLWPMSSVSDCGNWTKMSCFCWEIWEICVHSAHCIQIMNWRVAWIEDLMNGPGMKTMQDTIYNEIKVLCYGDENHGSCWYSTKWYYINNSESEIWSKKSNLLKRVGRVYIVCLNKVETKKKQKKIFSTVKMLKCFPISKSKNIFQFFKIEFNGLDVLFIKFIPEFYSHYVINSKAI